MVEVELIPDKLSDDDNRVNVEMTEEEIWFLKHFIKTYHPKKIVEVGIASGGNTVNLLKWRDEDAELFSVDVAKYMYKDKSKLSGYMAKDLGPVENWKLYGGYDYIDVYKEIGNDIDCIIIDTTHIMPGECLTFLAALPQLKEGCIVILHDIHFNCMRLRGARYSNIDTAKFSSGILYSSVRSNMKWTLSTYPMSNIGAFIIDNSTKDNIKDLFHALCTSWYKYPFEVDFAKYKEFIAGNYSEDCSKLFNSCVDLYGNLFGANDHNISDSARVDIINNNYSKDPVEIIYSSNVDIEFPSWFEYPEGKGAVLKTKEKSFDITLKCVKDGELKISLRGPDVRVSGRRVPSSVKYTSLLIDNENMINEPIAACHDNSYVFRKKVKDGEVVELHFEWEKFTAPSVLF
ncbi:class I SAM-dependent methyltransferase [uncultured Methanobrevibacter sp.]|uniref:class I SAM-dependent methyltransferase n=1 Tax=uncultured Methanobrevibacter sp. TaxID=253161 RepID=UPI002634060C|nr:class I SAM-dependent methyltransferase [uncultured Methanobrevibacter sp.]